MLVDENGAPLACFECGKPAEHQHHVVPRSRGGTKTVPLCHDCHDLVHFRTDDAGSLLRSAYLQARAAVQLGAEAMPNEPDEPADAAPIEVTDSDRRSAAVNGTTPEFEARLKAKIRARR